MLKRLLVLLSVLILIILAGCGNQPATNKKEFTIVTSFYPIYVATINITRGIDGVKVVNMTKAQTGCLHDYQLSPEDLKTLETADVFIVNGAGMEDFLGKVLEQRPNLKIIDASQGIELIQDESGTNNPHVWVSISNAMQQVKNIAMQLAAVDSVHAVAYENNAARYNDKLAVLRQQMHDSIDNLPHKDIVTFHEAFPYFAKEFNLHTVAVVEREPGSEPSAADLAATIVQMKMLGGVAIFAEPQYPSKAADMIARETGSKVYTLDPVVTGDATPDAYDAYINAMDNNRRVLMAALQ